MGILQMSRRKSKPSFADDTQPIDYKRLAKEVVKEQKQQEANRQGCSCLLIILVIALVWAYLNFAGESGQTESVIPAARSRATAIPTHQSSSQSKVPRAWTAAPTIPPTQAQMYMFHVCPDRVVNMRTGPGFSNYPTAGEMIPGRSYPVLAHVQGESVQGNTTWYQILHDAKTAYVTAHYTYACDETAPVSEPRRDPAERATISYISTCKDEDLLSIAQASKAFRHNEVRRSVAFCASKQVMVDLKVNGVFDTLDEAKREMYALLCELRKSDYGITFDVDGNFYDYAGNEMESRAVLARFEADVVGRINCASYHGTVNWDYAAEEWWVHRALTD